MNLTIYHYREGENWQRLNGGVDCGSPLSFTFCDCIGHGGKGEEDLAMF